MTFATVDGLDRFSASVESVVDSLREGDPGVGDEAGSAVLVAVDPPIRTGRLASTVRLEATAHGFTLHAGGPSAPYGAIVHARDPFLTDALEERADAAADAYHAWLTDQVATIQGK